MAASPTRWAMEAHTAAKHEILRRYLNAWFPILGAQHARVVFLDGFAGPGVYADGEPGSPIVALSTLLEHRFFPRLRCQFVFWFLEPRPDRYETLTGQFTDFVRYAAGCPRTSRSSCGRRPSRRPPPPWSTR